jgi:glycosyltransferase involved in cell wall biosynthesis
MYNFIKRLFDKAYSKADQLIALGRDMHSVLKEKVENGSKSKGPLPCITIIENWADIDNIRPQPMPEGKIILEYAGNIGRVQGLDKIIERLPSDVELHLYGTGSMENNLKKLKHPHVFFHGPYFRSQQNKILAACHIAIVTLQDGMYGLGVPSKTYNILASGRPIMYIGPKNSEIDLLVRDEQIGYCGWPNRWYMDELKSMGLKAREVAEKKYSKTIILNKFLETI